MIAELGKYRLEAGPARARPPKEDRAGWTGAEAQGEAQAAVNVTVVELEQEQGSGRPDVGPLGALEQGSAGSETGWRKWNVCIVRDKNCWAMRRSCPRPEQEVSPISLAAGAPTTHAEWDPANMS